MLNFGKISRFYLMGGGRILYEFLKFLKSRSYEVYVFTSERRSKEWIKDRLSFEELVLSEFVPYFKIKMIEQSDDFLSHINEETLGIGFGEDWTFSRTIIDRFHGRLVDLMGIRLPQYRGGAHYSWQILRKNRIGACHLQLINEEMVQGKFDSGEIIRSKEYMFPDAAMKPKDYFATALREELAFLQEFVEDLEKGVTFSKMPIPENFSMFFPRLYTPKHGWIDWSWGTEDIALFVRAFDDPYAGASTYLGRQMVRIKDVRVEYGDGPFHPFQAGLIYRKTNNAIFVATKDGTLIIRQILNVDGDSIFKEVKVGERLFTPSKKLEEAITFSAEYDTDGIKLEKEGV